MLDPVTMSDLEEQVAMSSESWDCSPVRSVSDTGRPAQLQLWRDQALALRARPRGHVLALEVSVARQRTRPPDDGGHEHEDTITQANRERNAHVKTDDLQRADDRI